MSHFVNAVRAAAAASLVGGLACLGPLSATAAPSTGDPADVNKLAGMLSKGYTLSNCTPQSVQPGLLAFLICGQNPEASGVGREFTRWPITTAICPPCSRAPLVPSL